MQNLYSFNYIKDKIKAEINIKFKLKKEFYDISESVIKDLN